MRIGFVGSGRMGSGMAASLLRAGHEVAVYNRTREKAEALSEHGARLAASPREAARGAEAVFTMLSDDSAVAEVTGGPDGIIAGLSTSAVHISASTISIAFARRLAQLHKDNNQGFISAPVFGRPDAAEAKKLIVVTGGEAALCGRFHPLFEAIGRRTFAAGPEPWQANLFKLCGNFMIASMIETFGEAFAAVSKAGSQPQSFLEVMNELFGSPVYKNYGATIADEKFEPAGFALKLGLKDIRQALEAGQELNVALPIASLLRDNFLAAMANGQEQLDWSSLSRIAKRNAGLLS